MDIKTFTRASDIVEKQNQISEVLGVINNRGEGEILQLFWGRTSTFDSRFTDLPDHILNILVEVLTTEHNRLQEEFDNL